jgi:hypothetical protein
MFAVYFGHPAIVDKLVVARADLNTKSNYSGCALPVGPSGGVVGRRLCRLRLAPSGRSTALHCAAAKGCTKSSMPLLVGGADQTITNNEG